MKNTAVLRLLASIAIFEAGWFACVIGAARGALVWGILAAAAATAWQLGISRRRGADLLLMAAALGVGLVWDTALGRAHLVVYASHLPLATVAPCWILALWVQFGGVLREPLRWLHGRPALAAVFGGAGGAASYAGAARLGACTFPDTRHALVVLAVGWAVIFPLLAELARRLDTGAVASTR